jgi:hypothetical protein
MSYLYEYTRDKMNTKRLEVIVVGSSRGCSHYTKDDVSFLVVNE